MSEVTASARRLGSTRRRRGARAVITSVGVVTVATVVVSVAAIGCVPVPGAQPERTAGTVPREPRSAAAPGHRTRKEQVLPSGLRLLLEEDPYATLAGVVSVVRGGSGANPAGGEGLAHLVEHLTYRAVDPPGAGEQP